MDRDASPTSSQPAKVRSICFQKDCTATKHSPQKKATSISRKRCEKEKLDFRGHKKKKGFSSARSSRVNRVVRSPSKGRGAQEREKGRRVKFMNKKLRGGGGGRRISWRTMGKPFCHLKTLKERGGGFQLERVRTKGG